MSSLSRTTTSSSSADLTPMAVSASLGNTRELLVGSFGAAQRVGRALNVLLRHLGATEGLAPRVVHAHEPIHLCPSSWVHR